MYHCPSLTLTTLRSCVTAVNVAGNIPHAICACGKHTAHLTAHGGLIVTGMDGAPLSTGAPATHGLADPWRGLPFPDDPAAEKDGKTGAETPRKSGSKGSKGGSSGKDAGGAAADAATTQELAEARWLRDWAVPTLPAAATSADAAAGDPAPPASTSMATATIRVSCTTKTTSAAVTGPGHSSSTATHPASTHTVVLLVAVCTAGDAGRSGTAHLAVVSTPPAGSVQQPSSHSASQPSSPRAATYARAQIAWHAVTAPPAARLARPTGLDSQAKDAATDIQGKNGRGKSAGNSNSNKAKKQQQSAAAAAGKRSKDTGGRGRGGARVGGEDGGAGDDDDADANDPALDLDAYYDYAAAPPLAGRAHVEFAGRDAIIWWDGCTQLVRCTIDDTVARAASGTAASHAAWRERHATLAERLREHAIAAAGAASSSTGKTAAGSKKNAAASARGGGGGGGGKDRASAASSSSPSTFRDGKDAAASLLLQSPFAPCAFVEHGVWHLAECVVASAPCPTRSAASIGGARGSVWIYDARAGLLRAVQLATAPGRPNRPDDEGEAARRVAAYDPVVPGGVCMASGRRVLTAHESGTLAAHDLRDATVVLSTVLAGRAISGLTRIADDRVAAVVDGWDVRVVDMTLGRAPAVTGRVIRSVPSPHLAATGAAALPRKASSRAAAEPRQQPAGSDDPRHAPPGHLATVVAVEHGTLHVVDTDRRELSPAEIAARRESIAIYRRQQAAAAATAADAAAAADAESGGKRKKASKGGSGGASGGKGTPSKGKDSSNSGGGGGGGGGGGDGYTDGDGDGSGGIDALAALAAEVTEVRVSVSVSATDLASRFPRPSSASGVDAADRFGATDHATGRTRNGSFSFSVVPEAISARGSMRRSKPGRSARDVDESARSTVRTTTTAALAGRHHSTASTRIGQARDQTARAAEAQAARAAEAQAARAAEAQAAAATAAAARDVDRPLGTPLISERASAFAELCRASHGSAIEGVMANRLELRNLLREATGGFALDPSEEGSLTIARA
jgi:uncharacterized membrane protein YgcG